MQTASPHQGLLSCSCIMGRALCQGGRRSRRREAGRALHPLPQGGQNADVCSQPTSNLREEQWGKKRQGLTCFQPFAFSVWDLQGQGPVRDGWEVAAPTPPLTSLLLRAWEPRARTDGHTVEIRKRLPGNLAEPHAPPVSAWLDLSARGLSASAFSRRDPRGTGEQESFAPLGAEYRSGRHTCVPTPGGRQILNAETNVHTPNPCVQLNE